jgi:putative transposase
MPTITKTMQYEIIKPLSCDWTVFGHVLRQVQHESFRIKNRVIQLYYQYENDRLTHKQLHGVYPNDKEKYGAPFATYVYRVIAPEFPVTVTTNMTSTIQKATKAWKSSRSDVMKGNKSIPSFRRNNPIELKADNIRNLKWSDKNYVELDLGLVSTKGVEYLKSEKKFTPEQRESISTSYHVLVHGGKNGAKEIMDRLISAEYKLCGSMILYNERKRKWMLTLTYQFEAAPKSVNPNRVLGVDMGITNAAYMALNDNRFWRERIDGGQIEQHRRRIEAQRRKLASQAAVCGEARIGHGRKKRMKPLDKLESRISNFRNTVNHTYARRIVEIARRMECGVIQVEDLTGISEGDTFLGRWTYFDLQTKIENKASEYGIEVRKIKPNWTSKRCSECGHIAHENRDIKRDQAKFHCVMCGYEVNADFNAARNIAIPNIEEIIKEKCKTLGLAYDKEDFDSDNENGNENTASIVSGQF